MANVDVSELQRAATDEVRAERAAERALLREGGAQSAQAAAALFGDEGAEEGAEGAVY